MISKLLAAAVLATLLPAVKAQPQWIMRATAGMSSGVNTRLTTYVEPAATPSGYERLGGGIQVEGNLVHRFFENDSGGIYFGYDLRVEPLPEAGQFRVSIEPLALKPQDARFLRKSSGHALVPLPRYPAPQIVRDGEVMVLDVLVDPRTGQKIFDQIEVSRNELSHEAPPGETAPRDFTVFDAELTLKSPELRINNALVPGTESWKDGGMSGSVVLFCLPDRGRFILTLAPVEGFGFQKAGFVQGRRVWFQVGADQYELATTARVAPGRGAWNLYVIHEPGVRGSNQPEYGSADRVERLLLKR